MSGFYSWRCWWCHVALMNFSPIHSDWQLHPQVQDHHHQLVPDGQDLHRHQHAEDPHNQVEPQLKQLLDTLASRCRPNANLQADKFRRWTDPFLQILGTNLDIIAPLVMIRICPSLIWMIQKSRQKLETEWQRLLNEVLVSWFETYPIKNHFVNFISFQVFVEFVESPWAWKVVQPLGKSTIRNALNVAAARNGLMANSSSEMANLIVKNVIR